MTIRDIWYRISKELQEIWKQTLQTSTVSCTELIGDSSQIERIKIQDGHPLRLLGIRDEFCLIQAELNRKPGESTIIHSRRTENIFHVQLSRSEEPSDIAKLGQAELTMVL